VIRDFREFLTKGSFVDLAVAVVLALAAADLIRSLVVNVALPLVAIPGKFNFSTLAFDVRGVHVAYGEFINDFVTFVVVAAVVFLGVVRPFSRLRRAGAPPPIETAPCPRCLSTVPAAATKCPFCTADIAAST
jgi:large conductance mechanosensitive channel